MRFEININKWHLVAVLILFVFVSVVIAYGTSNPPNFGHSSGEIQVTGVPGTPNQTLNSFLDWLENNVNTLNGNSPYCSSTGLNCPSINRLNGTINSSSVPSGVVHKMPPNYRCQDSAFLCAVSTGGSYVFEAPRWLGGNVNRWAPPSQSGFNTCAWVLCDKPDLAYP